MFKYKSIKNSTYEGYILEGLDFRWIVKKIKNCQENGAILFYSSEPHRKTYFDDETKIYIKITEEHSKKLGSIFKWKTYNKTWKKYFKYYNVLNRIKIPTPKLLASLNDKKEKRSIIITEAVLESQTMASFLCSIQDSQIRSEAIEKVAEFAAVIHRNRYYVSLDLRNILVRMVDKKVEIFILDLEHMKPLGFLRRRLRRNILRARESFLFSMDGNLEMWESFLNHYKKSFNQGRVYNNIMKMLFLKKNAKV